MRRLTLLAAASALALGGAGIAMASQQAGAYPKTMRGGGPIAALERADTNGDGEISLEEAKAHGAERFARMDANADGSLSKADREARAEQRFARADANGDGEVTPQEMTAAREAREAARAERRAARAAQRQAMMFEKLDTDGSGGLSQAEMETAKALRAQAREEAGGERRGRRGGERLGRRGGRGGADGAMRMLRRADTNNDEAVSREEFDAAIEARFARLDTDGSGTISAAERKAAMERLRANRGGHRFGPRGDKPTGAGS